MDEENKKCKKCGINDAWNTLQEGLCDDCYDSRHESTSTSEEIKQREREREREQTTMQVLHVSTAKKMLTKDIEKSFLIQQ